jgi:hypothetical protein
VSAKEYREYADECMGWAKTASTDKERLNFIEMANTWLQAAALSEAANWPSANTAAPPINSAGMEQIAKD